MKWNVTESCVPFLCSPEGLLHTEVWIGAHSEGGWCAQRQNPHPGKFKSHRGRQKKIESGSSGWGGISVKHKSLLEMLPVPWRSSQTLVKHMICTWDNRTMTGFFYGDENFTMFSGKHFRKSASTLIPVDARLSREVLSREVHWPTHFHQ